MNERIKELAVEANVRPLYSPAYAPRYIFEEEELEKFAELIVKECASVALMSNGNNLYVCELIKEHFGVEE